RAGHVHQAGTGAAIGGLEQRVGGIVQGDAVGGKRIRVNVGLQGVGSGRPDALFILLHGNALADAGDEDFLGIGGAETEGDLAVGGNFRGLHGGRAAAGARGRRGGRGRGGGLGGSGGGGAGEQNWGFKFHGILQE